MNSLKVGIIGLGTVGTGVLQILSRRAEAFEKQWGIKIEVAWCCDRDESRHQIAGKYGCARFTTDAYELINSDVDLVVELIGGFKPACDFIQAALEKGKSVVTANKEVVSQKGQELLNTASANGVDFLFEASVGGGIPIIKPLKEMLAGNNISYVAGIVNGTTNYVLSSMAEEGLDFNTALEKAKEHGYAEPDPSADIEGDDAASKIAILASIAFNSRVKKDQVYKEGISRVTVRDINYARELGYAIKLLAYARRDDGGIFAFARPALIPVQHPLASVSGVYNAIFVHGDACGDLMFFGEGAGSLAAGSSVVGDILQVARNHAAGVTGRTGCGCYNDFPVRSNDEYESAFYINLKAADRPGVLAKIAGCFGDARVSIASVIQKETVSDEAFIVFMTHKTKQKNILDAVQRIARLDVVKSVENVMVVVDSDVR